MTSQPFRLILPGQQRLREAFDAVLDRAGFTFSKPARRAASGLTRDRSGGLPDLETYELRSEAALEWLSDDAADLAVAGQDILLESAATRSGQTPAPRSLLSMERVAACGLWLAARPETRIENIKDLESMRIATSYPGLLQQILDKQGVRAGRILAQKGGIESTITAGRADVIFEVVQTGESLRQNGLVKKCALFNSCAQLVRTPQKQDPRRERLIEAFTARIAAALSQNLPQPGLQTPAPPPHPDQPSPIRYWQPPTARVS